MRGFHPGLVDALPDFTETPHPSLYRLQHKIPYGLGFLGGHCRCNTTSLGFMRTNRYRQVSAAGCLSHPRWWYRTTRPKAFSLPTPTPPKEPQPMTTAVALRTSLTRTYAIRGRCQATLPSLARFTARWIAGRNGPRHQHQGC